MWRDAVVYAQESGSEGGGSSPGFGNPLFFMMMIFGIFYFLLIRPNQKRERERRSMLESLSKGSKVVTNGGICGTIVGISEKTVVLKVSDDPVTKIEFVRSSVSQVAAEESDEDESK